MSEHNQYYVYYSFGLRMLAVTHIRSAKISNVWRDVKYLEDPHGSTQSLHHSQRLLQCFQFPDKYSHNISSCVYNFLRPFKIVIYIYAIIFHGIPNGVTSNSKASAEPTLRYTEAI